jgi:tRNA (cmo5U34)-methyltransferase
MNVVDFSFQDHAKDFDDHISRSIPGYRELVRTCVRLSRRFVQPGTTVVDVGCSTGHLLASIQESNKAARPDVNYVGLDCVPDFSDHWGRLEIANVGFEVCDARSYQGFKNVSLAYSLFTIQFVRAADKMSLLQRIYDGLVDGGALIIAEKTFAESARLQDALTGPYYDSKLDQGFSEKEVLDKERSLRGLMTLWTEAELRQVLRRVGFQELQPIWGSSTFIGLLALK